MSRSAGNEAHHLLGFLRFEETTGGVLFGEIGPKNLSLIHILEHQARALESAGIPYTFDPKEDYEVVHLNTVFPDSLWMSLKARMEGKRVVYYAHSTMEDFRNSFIGSNMAAGLFRRWIRRCYRSGDVVITPTPYSARLLQTYGINREIVPLSNGIDLAADVYKRQIIKRGKKMAKAIKRYWPIFVLPTFLAFILGFIAPFIMGIYLSFCKFTTVTDAKFIGFSNYLKIFTDPSFVHALWYTALFTVCLLYTSRCV